MHDVAAWPALVWHPGEERYSDAFRRVVEPWIGTRYQDHCGVNGPGSSTDCRHFVLNVLRQLEGKPLARIRDGAPRDAGFHSGAGWGYLIRLWRDHGHGAPMIEPEDGMIVEPGDIIVVGRLSPAHVLFVGYQPNTLIHARRPEVTVAGWVLGGETMRRIIKPKRETWA